MSDDNLEARVEPGAIDWNVMGDVFGENTRAYSKFHLKCNRLSESTHYNPLTRKHVTRIRPVNERQIMAWHKLGVPGVKENYLDKYYNRAPRGTGMLTFLPSILTIPSMAYGSSTTRTETAPSMFPRKIRPGA